MTDSAPTADQRGSARVMTMTDSERSRLVEFLRRKQCGPCRGGALDASHAGCVEAEDLIEIVERG